MTKKTSKRGVASFKITRTAEAKATKKIASYLQSDVEPLAAVVREISKATQIPSVAISLLRDNGVFQIEAATAAELPENSVVEFPLTVNGTVTGKLIFAHSQEMKLNKTIQTWVQALSLYLAAYLKACQTQPDPSVSLLTRISEASRDATDIAQFLDKAFRASTASLHNQCLFSSSQ